MTRSVRNTPIVPVCQGRNAPWKSAAHRALRHQVNILMATLDEDVELPLLREVSDIWRSPSDGHCWIGNDANLMTKLMRK